MTTDEIDIERAIVLINYRLGHACVKAARAGDRERQFEMASLSGMLEEIAMVVTGKTVNELRKTAL